MIDPTTLTTAPLSDDAHGFAISDGLPGPIRPSASITAGIAINQPSKLLHPQDTVQPAQTPRH